MENKKQKRGMARLLELAATKKPFIVGAILLSVLASVMSFVPYIAIYLVAREILGALPNFAALDGAKLIELGWLAFGGVRGYRDLFRYTDNGIRQGEREDMDGALSKLH